MGKRNVNMIVAVVVTAIVMFVAMGGLSLFDESVGATYKVTVTNYDGSLVGSELELKCFGLLSEGYEIVSLNNGVGYILGDYGGSVKVVGILNGVEDDAYYSVPVGTKSLLSTCGDLFYILIERI